MVLVGSSKYNENCCQVCKNVIETFNLLLIRKFTDSVLDLHVVINVWSTSCRVRCVLCNVTVKLMTNSDAGEIITRITIGKAKGMKFINKQAFLVTSKQLATVFLTMTLI